MVGVQHSSQLVNSVNLVTWIALVEDYITDIDASILWLLLWSRDLKKGVRWSSS